MSFFLSLIFMMRPKTNAIRYYRTVQYYKPELQFKEPVAHVDSVACPHHIDAAPDLDPAFHFHACPDPDPTFHPDADLDPTTHFFPDLDPSLLQNDSLTLPTFHFDADLDPDPAFHLCGSGKAALLVETYP
jgi:hypothetical protein